MKGHIRQRGKKSWEVKVDLGRDPFTGKRRTNYHTIKGTKQDAERELRRILREIDTQEYVEPSKIKVSEFLDRWLDHVQTQVAPKTYERYAEITRKHLSPTLGHHKLSGLRPMHIADAWSRALKSGRRDGKGGLSPLTVRHHHRVMKQALGQAVRWQLLARNPMDGVDAPRVTRKRFPVLDPTETALLLQALRETDFYLPTLIAVSTDMRRGEILALRWQNVDLTNGSLNVMESLEQTRSGLRFKETKNSKSRNVVMPSILMDELRRHKVQQAERLLKGGVRQAPDHLVCCRPDGRPINPEWLSREFPVRIAKAGLQRVRFHDLRHSHASHMLLDGIHPKVAQERLGHSSITVTQDLYSHLLPSLQKDAADKLDTALRNAIENTGS